MLMAGSNPGTAPSAAAPSAKLESLVADLGDPVSGSLGVECWWWVRWLLPVGLRGRQHGPGDKVSHR